MRLQGAVWLIAAAWAGVTPAAAQDWDWGDRLSEYLKTQTRGQWAIEFEQRERYENHTGQTFGKDPDLFTGLVRTRVGLIWRPLHWLKISGMMQDARAPWYGDNAPNTV